MTYTENSLAIEGITEPAVVDYFTTFNQAEFGRTAALFTQAGELLAPFEKPIVGRDSIAAYLQEEARGMTVLPRQGILEATEVESRSNRYKVVGKVKTPLFSVNVAWFFTIGDKGQIATVRIKLLASPQELLSLKSQQKK